MIGKFPSFSDLTETEQDRIAGQFRCFGLTVDDSEEGPDNSRVPTVSLARYWAIEAYTTVAFILARREGEESGECADDIAKRQGQQEIPE